jgi:hypothetical protein
MTELMTPIIMPANIWRWQATRWRPTMTT